MTLERKPGVGQDAHRRVVSPIYAMIGASPSQALRVGGDARGARRIIADWVAWKEEYELAWRGGAADVPPPPHHELFPGYARQA